MMHYEYFINLYKCVYNALWLLVLIDVLLKLLFKHSWTDWVQMQQRQIIPKVRSYIDISGSSCNSWRRQMIMTGMGPHIFLTMEVVEWNKSSSDNEQSNYPFARGFRSKENKAKLCYSLAN